MIGKVVRTVRRASEKICAKIRNLIDLDIFLTSKYFCRVQFVVFVCIKTFFFPVNKNLSFYLQKKPTKADRFLRHSKEFATFFIHCFCFSQESISVLKKRKEKKTFHALKIRSKEARFYVFFCILYFFLLLSTMTNFVFVVLKLPINWRIPDQRKKSLSGMIAPPQIQ